MPIVRNVTGGSQVVASAKIARQYTLTIAAGASSLETDAQLQTNTLPNGVWWCLLAAGAPVGCTITPMFGVTNRQAIVPEIDYKPLIAPQLLVAGIPFAFDQRVGANAISAVITVPGGGAGASATLILAASI